MEVIIDIERLRSDLIDYFGTAMNFYSVAVVDLTEVSTCSGEKLIQIAIKNNFDLSNYIIDNNSKKQL